MKFCVLVVIAVLGGALAKEDKLLNLASDNPKVLRALFNSFKKDFGKEYKDAQEARMRLSQFRGFVKEAAKINAEQDDVKIGITMFADMTEDEKRSYTGANVTSAEEEAQLDHFEAPQGMSYPTAVSHRSRYGRVKNQGQCGSCWTFGAVGVVEGMQSISRGRYIALSEQQVLDCSGGGDCLHGGYHSRALQYIQRGHLSAEYYYRYQGRKGRCASSGKRNYLGIRISRVSKVYGGDNGLASALNRGPVSVLLYNFHGVSVMGYKDGVMGSNFKADFYGPSKPSNHVVTCVGYTSTYWDIRNSWGSGWGRGGYFQHSRRINNNIGISSHAYTITYSRSGREVEEEE